MNEWHSLQKAGILDLLKPDWHYADIGASVGAMTDVYKPLMERGYLFDASSLNYNFLKQKYGDTASLVINHAAASDEDGTANFSINLNDPAVGSLAGTLPSRITKAYFNPVGGRPPYQEKIEVVKTITLDTYFKNKRIDFIKVDAEGAEWRILKGAKDIMSQRSIVFQIEFHWDEHWDQRSILEEVGYNIYTSKDWMGGNESQTAFSEGFFELGSSAFRKLPSESPRPYQALVAKADWALSPLLN